MSFRAATIFTTTALAMLVVAVMLGAGATSASGQLGWVEQPLLVVRGAGADRICTGWVENRSDETTLLDAKQVRLRDRQDRIVPGVVTFIPGYAHGVLPMDRGPYPTEERRRLGRVVEIPPGGRSRVTVSWERPVRQGDPVAIEFGRQRLPTPTPAR